MKYLFVLGNHPHISLAELENFFGKERLSLINKNIAILKTEKINPIKTIKSLGGIIKIASLETSVADGDKALKKALAEIALKKAKKQTGKFKFGLSSYSPNIGNTHKLGLEIKKELKAEGMSSRLVTSKEKTLSSVVVETNNLARNGLEIILAKKQNQILIGQTLTVQDFRSLSDRDYGRPQRDSHSGMLPPKLAQIMINLGGIKNPGKALLLDPFCGSGTILAEATLSGWQNLIGTDTSEKAIQDTKANLSWLREKHGLKEINLKIFKEKAENLSAKFDSSSIDLIVTEPYLGPQRGEIDFSQVVSELEKLYTLFLKEAEKILKPGGKIVMIWPVFQNGSVFLNPTVKNLKKKEPLDKNLITPNSKDYIKTRKSLLYYRSGQKVWREIVILQKS